jgi:uncharacterized protein (DUF427 family)
MTRAIWNDTVIAESNETEIVEGNHNFPLDSLAMEHLARATPRAYVLGKESPNTTRSSLTIRRT